MSIWDKFDQTIDQSKIKADIVNAKENKRENVEIPTNEIYRMEIINMECGESSKGDPMVKIEFKITQGEFKNYHLWWNQVITQGFQIHLVNEFLRSLDTDIEIEWESYAQYADLIMDVFEEVEGTLEYDIKYTKKGDFPNYEVLEVYES